MSRRLSLAASTPLAGLLAVLCTYLAARFGNVAGGLPSPFDLPAEEVVAYLTDHVVFVTSSSYLLLLAAAFELIFAGGLHYRLKEFGSGEVSGWATVGLAGAGLHAGLMAVSGLLQSALAGMTFQQNPAESVVAGLAVTWIFTVVVLVPASVPMLAGFGMALRRSEGFSGLIAGLALWGAGLGLVPLPDLAGQLGPAPFSISFVLSQIQPWLLLLWILSTAFVLRRERVRASKAAEAKEGESAGD